MNKFEAALKRQHKYINGIEYIFETQEDGWIGIYEKVGIEYVPMIQAKDEAHALNWCSLRECIPVPVNAFN